MQDSKTQSTSFCQRLPLRQNLKRRGQRRSTYSVELLSSHALISKTSPPPQRVSFEAALLHFWSMDLTVRNGLQTTTSSHCLHFQVETADILRASSILISVHHFGRRKGEREGKGWNTRGRGIQLSSVVSLFHSFLALITKELSHNPFNSNSNNKTSSLY